MTSSAKAQDSYEVFMLCLIRREMCLAVSHSFSYEWMADELT